MKRKTATELERHKVIKTTRALVRLKHSLAADEELNSILPDTIEQFDEAHARGELVSADEAIDTILRG